MRAGSRAFALQLLGLVVVVVDEYADLVKSMVYIKRRHDQRPSHRYDLYANDYEQNRSLYRFDAMLIVAIQRSPKLCKLVNEAE